MYATDGKHGSKKEHVKDPYHHSFGVTKQTKFSKHAAQLATYVMIMANGRLFTWDLLFGSYSLFGTVITFVYFGGGGTCGVRHRATAPCSVGRLILEVAQWRKH
jgi:hypothetical protein